MKIAAVQMVATPRVADNLARAAALIEAAAQAGAELVALPEYFCLMGLHDRDKLTIAEPLASDPLAAAAQAPIQHLLADTARRHGVWLLGGTLPLAVPDDPQHVLNTTLVYSPEGQPAGRYDKIHLFRFDNGEQRYDEAVVLKAGDTPSAFDARDRGGRTWRVGLSVCYDLRFPELYRHLSSPEHGGPCDLLTVPAAFTYPTGQAHWELLLRTRAVENQCYVLASAQGGTHENGRRTWGHSMIIDPWGEVLDVLPEGEGFVIAEMNPRRLAEVRTQLPALSHRKLV